MDVLIITKRCHRVVKLKMGLHHENLKVTKFMMKFHHKSLEKAEVNVEASSHGLTHLCRAICGRFHKKD